MHESFELFSLTHMTEEAESISTTSAVGGQCEAIAGDGISWTMFTGLSVNTSGGLWWSMDLCRFRPRGMVAESTSIEVHAQIFIDIRKNYNEFLIVYRIGIF